jgi:hypothetical protein
VREKYDGGTEDYHFSRVPELFWTMEKAVGWVYWFSRRVFWGWLNFENVQRNIWFFKKSFSLFLGPPLYIHHYFFLKFLTKKSQCILWARKYGSSYHNCVFILNMPYKAKTCGWW